MTIKAIGIKYCIDEEQFLNFLIDNHLEYKSGFSPSVDNDKVEKYVSLFLTDEHEPHKRQSSQPEYESREERPKMNTSKTEINQSKRTSYSGFIMDVGEKLYGFGRKGIVLGLPLLIGSSLLFLIIHFIAKGDFQTFLSAFVFSFNMLNFFQAIVVIWIYLLALWVLASPTAFLFGVHFIGLGQIAENTDKD